MKINRITIENFLGARAVDITLNQPAVLIAGPNGAGKSSVRDGIALALTADLGRVGLKKEAPQLIADGADAASVQLDTSAGQVSVAIARSGRIADSLKGVDLPPALPYVLDGQRFARMSPDDRRAFLFGLMGVGIGGDAVKARMAARGCDMKRVEQILPMLRAGFDAAQKEATGKARDAKAQWREITGETYGEKKAEGWQAPAGTPVDVEQLQGAQAAVEASTKAVAEVNQQLGALREQQRQHQATKASANGLQQRAAMKPRIQEKLKRDRAELAEWQAKVEKVRAAAGVAPRKGLIHDLARSLNETLRIAIPFGDLDAHQREHLRVANADLEAYVEAHGPITQAAQHDMEMAAKIPQYEDALRLSQSAVNHGERDLADAEAAERALAEADSSAEPPDAAAIEAAEQQLRTAQADQKQHQDALDRLRQLQAAAQQADGKTTRANELHQAVLAWTAIGDALAPGGIPGEILAEAMEPLNDRLMHSAVVTEWPRVGIDTDMGITQLSGTGDATTVRPYALLSESEQWRADAMIAEAIAHLSGLRLLLLDRFDVLDLRGRSDLLAWMDELAESGEIETAVIFGTLKALPAKLPMTMAAHWIDGGHVAQLQEAA